MRRVKDYSTFLNENLGTQKAVKTMARILNPKSTRNLKLKSESEIKSSFEEGEGVWNSFVWEEKKGGYVGPSTIFSGNVLIKEIDDDGDTMREYQVISGLNNGLTGEFTWGGSGENGKYPIYAKPLNKNWSDILGPDQNFLETYKSVGNRWATSLSEIEGIEIKKVKENGVCEFEYADIYQFFGVVRVYYTGVTEGSDWENACYSYEVKDGPNKGTKGKGFQIFDKAEVSKKSGIYSPFSNGDSTLNVIEYPANTPATIEITASSSAGGNGINPLQIIFFNTSSGVSAIKGPTKEIFAGLHGITKKYDPNSALESLRSKAKNVIFGKVEKSKIGETTIYCLQDSKTPSYFLGDAFASLDGIETTECYIANYQGHPLILYSVKCQKKDTPSLDNKGVGTYGNRFFSGRFYNAQKDSSYQVRGEWYYDYSINQIGIIYAYSVSDKKIVSSIENSLETSSLRDLDKPDFTNPLDKSNQGIIRDQSGGSWPVQQQFKEIPNLKFDIKNLKK